MPNDIKHDFTCKPAYEQTMIHTLPLIYSPDPIYNYNNLRGLGHAILFDSASKNRFDIILAQPIEKAHNVQELKLLLEKFYTYPRLDSHPDIPFIGGIAGCFYYDKNKMLIGLYDWALITDHLKKKTFILHHDFSKINIPFLKNMLDKKNYIQDFSVLDIQRPHTKNFYKKKIQSLQKYIVNGDCYQCNLAEKITATCSGDSLNLYQSLRKICPTNHSLYLEWEDKHLLCHSPERFIQAENNKIYTMPIKGTALIDQDPKKDAIIQNTLRLNAKELAENLMIVDLLRNDISQFCQPGSVHVEKLQALKTFANVHHLVSSISGTLSQEFQVIDLILGCLPGGSITGAPKIRSMQIIEELEGFDRDLYCGSAIYLSICGKADSNIIIRSLIRDGDKITTYGGGGITSDSQWQQEYQECYDKIGFILEELERRREHRK